MLWKTLYMSVFFITFNDMSIRYFVALIASISILGCATAQEKKKTASSGKTYATLVSASMQRTLPGMRGSNPITNYTFILKWKSKQAPETFFWRGTNAWMSCGAKLYKPKNGNSKNELSLEHIKAGDDIQLTAIPGGKFPMPEEIQNTKGQAIFFKTATSGWRYLPVTKITKLKDLAMP